MVRVGEQLVVVDLADEGNLVRVLPRDRAEDAERRGHRVAVALDRQLDDLGPVEVDGVGGKRRAGGVLDALVDRQDREVAGARQAAVVEERLQAAEDPGRPVAILPDPIDEVRPRQVQLLFRDGLGLVFEKALGVRPKHFFNLS